MRVEKQTAVLAKIKGFDEFCDWVCEPDDSEIRRLNYYEGSFNYEESGFTRNSEIEPCETYTHVVPTQSQLQTWLRETHNCLVIVDYHSEVDNDEMYLKSKSDIKYGVVVNYYGENFEIEQGEKSDYVKHSFDSYEDALEDGLVKALMMLPNL